MVMRRCGFKTFTPVRSPKWSGRSVRPAVGRLGLGAATRSYRWRSLGWPQVGEFGWPPGRRFAIVLFETNYPASYLLLSGSPQQRLDVAQVLVTPAGPLV